MTGFTRGLDHLVLCVPGLPLARAQFERLGFTATPDAFHPFGTCNFLVQLDGFFLEVLSIADQSLIHEHDGNAFSFPAFNRDFMKKTGIGLSMLVLDSGDEQADWRGFSDAGLKPHDPFSFGRKAQLPDGSEVDVKFSLTFLTDERMPEAAFFTCRQHHPPELFWKPQYQTHPNGAKQITEAVLVAEEPEVFRAFAEGFVQPVSSREEPGVLRFTTSRGDFVVMTPSVFSDVWGQDAPDLANGPRLAGFCLGVEKLQATADMLSANGIGVTGTGGRLVLDSRDCFGAALAFEVS